MDWPKLDEKSIHFQKLDWSTWSTPPKTKQEKMTSAGRPMFLNARFTYIAIFSSPAELRFFSEEEEESAVDALESSISLWGACVEFEFESPEIFLWKSLNCFLIWLVLVEELVVVLVHIRFKRTFQPYLIIFSRLSLCKHLSFVLELFFESKSRKGPDTVRRLWAGRGAYTYKGNLFNSKIMD